MHSNAADRFCGSAHHAHLSCRAVLRRCGHLDSDKAFRQEAQSRHVARGVVPREK
jgi:hypothetical protein